jgi:hypothetical protein
MVFGRSKGSAVVANASTGIGAVYAHRLAMRGYHLVLAAPEAERLCRFARWITAQTAIGVETLAMDPAEPGGLARLEARVTHDPTISFLVNNAFAAGADIPSLGTVEAMVALNEAAPARLARAAALAFATRRAGTLVNIHAGHVGGRFPTDPERAFLETLSLTLNSEYRSSGLHVQAILPQGAAGSLWDVAGAQVEHLPREMILIVEAMVDDALASLEAGEVVATLTGSPVARRSPTSAL